AVVVRKGKKTELKGIELPAQPVPARPGVKPPSPPGLPDAMPTLEPLRIQRGLAPQPLPAPAVAAGDGERVSSTSVSVNEGNFTIKSVQDDVNYTITGKGSANGPERAKVVIADGAKVIEAAELQKVPEQYRATAE